MNRNNEYLNLIENLDEQSEKIDNLYIKANRKLIKRRVFTAITSTFTTIASLITIFIILVNNVHSFAYACGGVSILKELAKFVAMSPSLSAAVEYQYVQPIELSKTQNDITANIEYVIVDQKQINIFYSLNSEKHKALQAFPEALNNKNESLECALMYGTTNEKNNLKMITLDFFDENVPDFFHLKLKVRDNGSYTKEAIYKVSNIKDIVDENTKTEEILEYVTEFAFDINLDPNYTSQGQTINLNKEFTVDNQTLKITIVDIYPTHIRISFNDNESNTKWLKSLNFRIEDEKGNKFEKISNGVSATGSGDSPMMASHRLESSFFSRSKELTLFIDEITWLDKDREQIKLDLTNIKYDTLPENVKLYKIEKHNNGWQIDFLVTANKPNHTFNSFSSIYHDELRNEYYINHSSTSWHISDNNGNNTLEENQFIETLYLTNYNKDIVYLQPLYTNIFTLDKPIEIKIK